MGVALVPIEGVDSAWETSRRIRALVIDGKSPAVTGLVKLQESHPDDFRQLLISLEVLAGKDQVSSKGRLKRGKRHRNILELRGGNARLFCFHANDGAELVICTHVYWKAKGSIKEQNEAFDKAERLRQHYLANKSTA